MGTNPEKTLNKKGHCIEVYFFEIGRIFCIKIIRGQTLITNVEHKGTGEHLLGFMSTVNS